MGYAALSENTTGTRNVAVGAIALDANTTAHDNTACGYQALSTNTTGVDNTAFGSGALVLATTANNNTALGSAALDGCTTGAGNTIMGYAAFYSGNVCLGYNAGNTGAPSGNITTGSRNVVLGDDNILNLFCADTSISSSDQRDKTDITDFSIGLKWIEALRPITYKWDKRSWYGTDAEPYGTPDGSKKNNKTHIGFLAQEALEVEKANGYGSSNDDSLVVNLTDDGMSYGMKYERLVPILVNAIKELSAKVTALEAA